MSYIPLQPKHPNNFGIIRYILAYSILISHFNVLSGNEIYWPISSYYRVCGFFFMSGFFMYGSYDRHRGMLNFLRHRAIRLLPSYLLVVLLFAVGLVVASSLSPWNYFTSPEWWKYLLANISTLNFLEPALPGVFDNNPEMAVNGSLWTMKVEWLLYFSVTIVMPLVLNGKLKAWACFIVVFGLSAIVRTYCAEHYLLTGNRLYHTLEIQYFGQASFFYLGMLFSRWLPCIEKQKLWLLPITFVMLLAGEIFLNGSLAYRSFFYPVFFSLLVICLAFTGRWGRWIEKWENCSYEIYLLHFPIIHLFVNYNLIDTLGVMLL